MTTFNPLPNSLSKTTLASKLAISTLSTAIMLSLSACGGSSGGSASNAKQKVITPVNLDFSAVAKDAAGTSTPVNCQKSYVVGTQNTAASIADLRFYIQDAYVVTKGGKQLPIALTPNDWQQTDVALIDLEDGTGSCAERGTPNTNATLSGQVESTYTNDDFVGIGFTVGVPDAKNHSFWSDAGTAAPLNIQSMSWAWQGGRKFMKVEIKPDGGVTNHDGTTKPIFNVHLGKDGCAPNVSGGGNATKGETVKCLRDNKFSAELTTDGTNPLSEQKVQLNLNALYAGSDVTQNTAGAIGCMSFAQDTDCPAIFASMGLDYNTGAGAQGAAGKQQLFSLVSK